MPLAFLLADSPASGVFGSVGILGCCFILPGILMFVFWLWMLIEVITRETSEGNEKLIWFLIIFFCNFLGALFYYFVRRPERKRRLHR